MRDFLHHLLFPRESNNHRAKILHTNSVLIFIIALLLGSVFLSQLSKEHSGVLGIQANISVDELLTITNQRRQEAGLAPLVHNNDLSQAAFKKAQDMLSKNYWAHNSPDGMTPWVFIKSSGYNYLYAGENLARGFVTAPDTVSAWMQSSGHRENMLSPNYKEIGFAIVNGTLTGDETVLVVEMFGSRLDNTAQSSVNAGQMALVLPTLTAPPPSPSSAVTERILVTPTLAQVQDFVLEQETPHGLSVASLRSEPLVDKKSFTRNIGFMAVLIILFVLVSDLAIVSRKKVIRVVSHNIDHIIFFTILLLSILIMGRGLIL